MPVPVEKIEPSVCFRAANNSFWKVLLRQDQRITYITHDGKAWNVFRYQANVENFAQECEAEIDCMTLKDL